jgi:hypothetical protein
MSKRHAPEAARSESLITAETLDRVTGFERTGLPVVSLYAGIDTGTDAPTTLRTRVASLLHKIRPLAEDRSLEREARLSVRGDIERITDTVEHERWTPGAVAFFSCSGAGLFEEVDLPRTVRDRVIVDATPLVRPMLAVLDEYHRYCVAVIDKESAQLWELYLEEMRGAGEVRGAALRKPDYAGWHGLAEHRVRNKADDLERRHYRQVAVTLDELFRTGRYELLAIGGHQHAIPGFIEFLPRSLRGRVAGTFVIDPSTATTADIRASADSIADGYERDEERQWVAGVLGSAAAGGLAAIGLEACLWAGSVAAIASLLVQVGAMSPGVVCDKCGWLGLSAEYCSVCGGPVRRTPDVIDELVEGVIDNGGSIEHVRADTELRRHAVAASLRFPLPPEPAPPPA